MSPITLNARSSWKLFACDVEVLGTHFDVIANQAENRFSTALFSGRVAVTNKNGESVILQPNDIVNLRDGGSNPRT